MEKFDRILLAVIAACLVVLVLRPSKVVVLGNDNHDLNIK